MKNLYERLRPEVLKGLEDNRSHYEFSVNQIIGTLKSNLWHNHLTVEQVSSLQTFSGVNAGDGDKNERWDWLFGDIWFYDWKDLENEMDNIEKDRINENN
jgi:hypothetical protein